MHGKILKACRECGQLTDMSEAALMTPRRSQPQTPLELPDVDGWWWDLDLIPRPRPMLVDVVNGVAKYRVSDQKCNLSKWVKCTPPLVAKAVDEDAQWCKSLTPGESYYVSTQVHERLQRIADRLEKEHG
jgi:hypothetical protein